MGAVGESAESTLRWPSLRSQNRLLRPRHRRGMAGGPPLRRRWHARAADSVTPSRARERGAARNGPTHYFKSLLPGRSTETTGASHRTPCLTLTSRRGYHVWPLPMCDTFFSTLWPFLMSQAAAIHNSLPSFSFSPPEVPWHKADPRRPPAPLSRFRVMLCNCWVHVGEPSDKLASRRCPAVHLGWDPRRRGYFVFVPSLRRITLQQ